VASERVAASSSRYSRMLPAGDHLSPIACVAIDGRPRPTSCSPPRPLRSIAPSSVRDPSGLRVPGIARQERADRLGRDAEELGDVRHLPQLDLVSAEEHISDLRESVPMLDDLRCRGRIPLAPITGKDASLKQPLTRPSRSWLVVPSELAKARASTSTLRSRRSRGSFTLGRLTAGLDRQA
jgi:hypothetical protein